LVAAGNLEGLLGIASLREAIPEGGGFNAMQAIAARMASFLCGLVLAQASLAR